jgi:acyl-CoA synthetase (AMP-forming)/AMP-acid ligase II
VTDPKLVAYYVCGSAPELAQKKMLMACRERLPNYMIPSFFVQEESLKFTPNGKIDRKAYNILETHQDFDHDCDPT